MIVAGIDIGSLTAKVVLLSEERIVARRIMRVLATARQSAEAVLNTALEERGLRAAEVRCCCATGYGRFEIPFAQLNKTEITCHALGAVWVDPQVRTIIDVGGQDCKVISTDQSGRVVSFVMNEKCAAGTGRSLELLAETLGIGLDELGSLSRRSRRSLPLSNKCSVFMELDVLQHMYRKRRTADIARAINRAVAKRVASLARSVPIRPNVVVTGGVAKNTGVIAELEDVLGVPLSPLREDPQLTGALGAAVLAARHAEEGAA